MTVDSSDLGSVLAQILSSHVGRPCVITRLVHHRYAYSTSSPLEEIEVELADGTSSTMILKDLSVSSLLADARAAKPSFLYQPRREMHTYQLILSRVQLGTAACYGAVADGDAARYWLFLEKVRGRELYQIGDVEVWQEVARWLAHMHGHCSLEPGRVRRANPHLIAYDAAYYGKWLDRARAFLVDDGSASQQRALSRVAEAFEFALERLPEMPPTFVHGEFYASNVLVANEEGRNRICPVDWEMAGVGPALLDLAALCTGWDDDNVRAIARCYYLAREDEAAPVGEEEFLVLLDCCRLYLAVQWLGWARQWSAPPEHARDWLAEASHLAERIIR